MTHRLIPLVLALVFGSQPIAQVWCGVACEGVQAEQSAAAPQPQPHSCHPAATHVAIDQPDPAPRATGRNSVHACTSCRRPTATLISELATARNSSQRPITAGTSDTTTGAPTSPLPGHDSYATLTFQQRTLKRSLPLELSATLRI